MVFLLKFSPIHDKEKNKNWEDVKYNNVFKYRDNNIKYNLA